MNAKRIHKKSKIIKKLNEQIVIDFEVIVDIKDGHVNIETNVDIDTKEL